MSRDVGGGAPALKAGRRPHTAPAAPGTPARPWYRRLSVRDKTLAVIAGTLFVLLVVIALPARAILLQSFSALEQRETRQNVERARNAIADDIATLDRTARDYASWDDTYAYAAHPDPAYVEANFSADAFLTNRLSFVAIVDARGEVLYAAWFDAESESVQPAPDALHDTLVRGGPLVAHASEESSQSGLLTLADQVYLVASRPILTSAYEGPVGGALVMGRALGADELTLLAETTRLEIQIDLIDRPASTAPQEVHRALLAPGAEAILVEPRDATTVAGYTLLRDIAGAPVLVLAVQLPRTLYAQGVTSVWYVLGAVLIASILVGVVLVLVLEWSVLAPLSALSLGVRRIGAEGDLTLRVSRGGDDELGAVADAVNTMLGDLERAQHERRRADAERGELIEQLARAKEQFFQMTVHDLKTPISSLAGFLDMLRLTQLDPLQLTVVDGMQRSKERLLQIVQDTLDTARLEEGRLVLRREPCQLTTLLSACVADLGAWAAEDGKTLAIDAGANSAPVLIDVSLIQRVMQNLVSNAIKHTPAGTAIRLGAATTSEGAQIWVWDGGPGIPAELHERIFQRFGGGGGETRRQGSTGLGLAFCKMAVEAHEGLISVTSDPEHGTRFTITLPPSALLSE